MTFRTPRSALRNQAAGFTLIELMIVMMLVAIASSVGVVVLSRSLTAKRLETSAWSLGSALQRARALALRSGRSHRLRINFEEGTFWIEGWTVAREGEEPGYLPLATDMGQPQELAARVVIERMSPQLDVPQISFDFAGRTEVPVRIILMNHRLERWTVAMGAANGRLAILPGEADPFSSAERPELALGDSVTDLPELGGQTSP